MAERAAPGDVFCALRGVGKAFGPVQACRGIEIEIRAGEVLAIAGENGAGKSTTLKCLCGYHSPTEGHVELDGEPVAFKGPQDGERVGIVMIPQELDLFPELSVAENVFVGLPRPRTRLGTFDAGAMRRRARELLGQLGLEVDVSLPVRHLSAANGKLVEIARALNARARLIIMDEPTAALSEREVERLLEVVRLLRSSGVAVLYITHRLDEIFAVSDRIVVLRDGALVTTVRTADETENGLVHKMVGRPVEQLFSRTAVAIGAPVLRLEALSAGSRFQDVSFELSEGEILGLSGLVGAGRTEVAETLFGLRRPTSGRVLIDGREVRIRSVADAYAHGIGYLPEERRSLGLVLPFTIEQNVTFSSLERFVRGGLIDSSAEHDFAEQAVSRVRVVGATLDAPVAQLSGGNQQKVVIAKVLAREPRILILDEPTRGVDVGAKSEIYRIIEDLARAGHCILLISSELNEVLSMSDRVAVMREGRLLRIFDRDEATPETVGAAAAGAAFSKAA